MVAVVTKSLEGIVSVGLSQTAFGLRLQAILTSHYLNVI